MSKFIDTQFFAEIANKVGLNPQTKHVQKINQDMLQLRVVLSKAMNLLYEQNDNIE